MFSLLRRFLPAQTTPHTTLAPSSRPAFRPQVHALEDRLTPALSFAGQQTFNLQGTGGNAVAVGDFNSDGRADLAVANANSVSVLLNTATAAAPSFAGQQPLAVSAASVAVGDFDGDGRADIVAVGGANTISVLRNATPLGASVPTFGSAQTFVSGASPAWVVVGDFNGDGRLDLATADSNQNEVSVLLNTTAAGSPGLSFTPRVGFAVVSPNSVAVGDFNGDGRLDLATARNFGSGGTVSVLLNTTANGATAPAFAAAQTFAVEVTPFVTTGDFDGDGRLDLATNNYYSPNSISVLRNTTTAGAMTAAFATQQTFSLGASPWRCVVGDFDGDGRADFATANFGGNTISVLLNTTAAGATTYSFAAPQSFAAGGSPYALAAGDFNGDGRADLAAPNVNGTTVSILMNTSTEGVVTGPALVAQLGAQGVWRYNRTNNSWGQLAGTNANALAAAPNGTVVASFGDSGVWLYRTTTGSWSQINGTRAVAVAIDPLGNAYVSFAGYGTYIYRLATAQFALLSPNAADKLAASANGDLVGNFGSAGVSRYRPTTGWVSLATPNADALAIGENGDVAANFGAYGVYRFKAGTWALINSNPATALAVGANGSVAASFGSFGVAKYIPYVNGWQSLHAGTQAPSVAIDLYGNVFASLSGFGVYEFNPYVGWRQRTPNNAGLLGLGR